MIEHVPTHHLHISTGFAFVVALLIVSLVGIIAWAIVASRRPRQVPQAEVRFSGINFGERVRPGYSAGQAPFAAAAPAAPSPVFVNSGSGTDMLTGVLLGEAMAGGFGHHDTVIVEDRGGFEPAPAYVSGPSCDSGFSFDSGSSCSSSDSSGGFDIDF